MATLYPDWAGLPQEMVATVMRALDIPDLFRAGTVCSSWYAAYSDVRRVRIPITDAAPCLLYSARDNGDASDATLYSPSSGGKAFKVRLPDPPLGSRALVGSSHGWLAAADEASNLHLVNPLTGAQVALPPVMALYHVESSVDEQGSLEYSVQEGEDPDDPVRYPAQKLRLFLYYKVAMSCSPSKVRDRIVLLLHRPDGQISFAHIGDDKWTQITDPNSKWDSGYRDALYNKNDGLFCVLSFDGSMLTLDLSDPSSPVAKDIVLAADRWFFSFHSAKRV
ncbi:LOW QUALITY PROTEIN: probable F-box protein At4g22165 [Setaria viridis]|uniref:LOW QUALITY PROTEIN: probable F-box protein At4g22165 n=1 Tax=Setaria viridis TaxID=4556 RepID=UPI003B3BB539